MCADAERTRHEHEVVVREQVDELGGLGMGGDERVAERQSHHAVGQFRNLRDFDVVARREESGRSRFRNHIMGGVKVVISFLFSTSSSPYQGSGQPQVD